VLCCVGRLIELDFYTFVTLEVGLGVLGSSTGWSWAMAINAVEGDCSSAPSIATFEAHGLVSA